MLENLFVFKVKGYADHLDRGVMNLLKTVKDWGRGGVVSYAEIKVLGSKQVVFATILFLTSVLHMDFFLSTIFNIVGAFLTALTNHFTNTEQ